jgi:hypothetical protein
MKNFKILGMQIRALNSVFLAFTAIPVAFTSILLYFVPADASSRQILSNVHVFLGFAFIASGTLHAIMNWRAIRAYFRKKIGHFVELRLEAPVAFIVFFVLLAGAVMLPALVNLAIEDGVIMDSNQVAAADYSSCSSCPYLSSYGSCHSGQSYTYNGTTYYGSDNGGSTQNY